MAVPRFEQVSFNAGISKFEDRGPDGSSKFLSALDIRRNVNSLYCAQALTDDLAAGTMTDLSLFQVPSFDGNTYHGCRDGKIFSRHPDGTYHLVYTDSEQIRGMSEYYDSASSTFLIWTTPTKVHCKKLIGTAYSNSEPWSDVDNPVPASATAFPKTDLTSATWHTAKWALGNLYIANADKLALVGWDGSYTNTALQLTPESLTKCMIEKGIYMYIGCDRKGNLNFSSAFAWDGGQAQNFNDQNIVSIKSINAMIDTEIPLAQVGTDGEVMYVDMSTKLPLYRFPGGGQVNPDGVDADSGMSLFGVYGNGTGNTGVYSVGRREKDRTYCVSFEYPLDCDEIGSVKKIGSDVFVTYKKGINYGVKHIDVNNKATGIFQTLDWKARVAGGETIPTWANIILTSTPLPSGCSVDVYRRMDKVITGGDDGNGFYQCNITDLTPSVITPGALEMTYLSGDKGKIAELKLVLHPNGNLSPEVLKIEWLMP